VFILFPWGYKGLVGWLEGKECFLFTGTVCSWAIKMEKYSGDWPSMDEQHVVFSIGMWMYSDSSFLCACHFGSLKSLTRPITNIAIVDTN